MKDSKLFGFLGIILGIILAVGYLMLFSNSENGINILTYFISIGIGAIFVIGGLGFILFD